MSPFAGIDGIDIIRDARTGRASSFDRAGANADAMTIDPGEADRGPCAVTNPSAVLRRSPCLRASVVRR